MSEQPGLRERKKQRTREAIIRAADELFVERGYHATTLADIAEAADVSTRTIFSYFRSKEEILFSDFTAMQAGLAAALAGRPEGEDALETVRTFVLTAQKAEQTDAAEQLHRCVMDDPTLRNHLRARIGQLVEVIAPAIADDLGVPESDVRVQVVSASLTAAFNVLVERGDGKAKPHSPEEAAAELDPIIAFLRGGLDALREPRKRRTA